MHVVHLGAKWQSVYQWPSLYKQATSKTSSKCIKDKQQLAKTDCSQFKFCQSKIMNASYVNILPIRRKCVKCKIICLF